LYYIAFAYDKVIIEALIDTSKEDRTSHLCNTMKVRKNTKKAKENNKAIQGK